MIDTTEHAILTYVEKADPREGRSTSWGTYSTNTGSINPTILLDLTKDLHTAGFLEVKKWTGNIPNGWATYPDPTLDDDEFFFRGDFRLRLTTKGRRRLEQLAKQQEQQPSVKARATITPQAPGTRDFPFDVAISFAGEQRAIAKAIAKDLSSDRIAVFYDEDEQATLWGVNLYDHLTEVYQHKARYCLLLASKEYAAKVWTTLERKSAQARAFQEKTEYILPVRIDDTEIPGILSTVGYLSFAEHGVDGICRLLRAKLGKPRLPEAPKPILQTNYEVVTSSRAFLLATHENLQAYIPVTGASWNKGKATFTCEPDDPTDGPFLDSLRGVEKPLFIAFKHNVGQCRVEDVEHRLNNGKDQWHLQLRIEETDFTPTMEFSYNNLTADQIAEQRARRILLDEKLPARANKNVWDEATDEVFARGLQVPIQTKASPFPPLYQHYGKNPQQFLEVAWITAVMLLKTTGVVEEVTSLKLSLNGQELHVAMRGKRRKQYSNQPAATIEVTGNCPLNALIQSPQERS